MRPVARAAALWIYLLVLRSCSMSCRMTARMCWCARTVHVSKISTWCHWKAATAAAGLAGLVPHDLRHTVATNLIREQVPLIDVSRSCWGTPNTAITEQIYINHQPQFLRPAVAKLDILAGVARIVIWIPFARPAYLAA